MYVEKHTKRQVYKNANKRKAHKYARKNNKV